MTEIKRFDMRGNTWPSDDGSIVSYKDHASIVAAKDALITALQEQVRALAAERDASRKAIAEIYMAVIGGRPGWSNWHAYLEDIVEEVATILSEIRAQSVDAASDELKSLATRSEGASSEHIHAAALYLMTLSASIRAGDQP